ncbi:FecR family protein [Arenibacter certesii]|uniref:FecR family protein n=1 Tax=Arenibacter certesii TaxID=228955 RepID=A0A918IM75_9FLAO|nr:FecR family protein [Arenibacter certesii]GGW22186.1 hypothetical protein GCM10007383_01780 [Arenibacter certesii]
MASLKRIISLSKRLALSILRGDSQDVMDLKSHFDEEDEAYILKNLTDKKLGIRRRKLRKEFDRSKKQELRKITGAYKSNYQFSFILRIAAVFIGILGLSYFFYQQPAPAYISEDKLPMDAIALRLDDGSFIEIDPANSTELKNSKGVAFVNQQKGVLKYKDDARVTRLMYNELYVPNGKKYRVYLSDGTQVILNSGSSLRYPVGFIKGHPREVFLKGEAFFSVAKDSTQVFSVISNEMVIKVLGTRFNISSYPGDPDISTVLTEGSVQFYNTNDPKNGAILTPGHMASWSREAGSFDINEVDVNLYTSWMDEELIFKSMSFENIIKKLERSYSVEIINNDKFLDKEIFTASFNVDIESITNVMDYFKLERPFSYSVSNKKIIINP